jgi:hypothetical protein
MQIAIISTGVAILLFLCLYLGFRTGLRLGMQSAKGILPHKIDPVNAVVSKVAEVKQVGQQNELLKGYANMMAFNGEPPKEGEK